MTVPVGEMEISTAKALLSALGLGSLLVESLRQSTLREKRRFCDQTFVALNSDVDKSMAFPTEIELNCYFRAGQLSR